MADKKISELTLGTPTDTDVIPFVDLATGTTKKAVKTDLKGADGTNGTDGTDGADGTSFTWKGAWSAGSYVANDVAEHNGSSWMATTTTTEEPSISATDWDLVALKGTDGAGSGDVVGPATNTNNYIPQWDGADSKTLKNGLSVADISQITNNADGFEIAGGTTERKLTLSGGDATIVGGGVATISFPTSTATLATLSLAETLSNKTISGSLTLEENASIALDPAGSADGKYTGITITGIAGATLAFGDLITLDKDDSRWEKVDISAAAAATGDARGLLGICVLAAANDGDATKILLNGVVRADDNFPTLTIGAGVYASTTGDVVVAQPTTTDYVIRLLGSALTANEFYFSPSPDFITHT